MTNSEVVPIDLLRVQKEYVEEYTNLCQTISFQDRLDKGINKRITGAWEKFWSFKSIFKYP